MKVKVSELSGAALDWAVAKCEGYLVDENSWMLNATVKDVDEGHYKPSQYWGQGGPIIEREIRGRGLDLWSRCPPVPDGVCAATYGRGAPDSYVYGPTPLIAAMRCYVASKLGEEVEIPKELV